MFDPRSRLIYSVIAIEAAIGVVLALALGIHYASWFLVPPLWVIWLIACGPLARRIGHHRVGGSCETIGLIYSQGLIACSILIPFTMLGGPLIDAHLLAADQALGFRGMSFPYAKFFYGTFMFQPLILLPVLFATEKSGRAWKLVTAGSLALAVCACVHLLIPATGTDPTKPWVPVIHALRAGQRVLDRSVLVGFISFPSYHAVAATLYAWGAWPMKRLRWPFLVLNVLMALAALAVGGHYLVDILAGVGVAAALLALLDRRKFELHDAPSGASACELQRQPIPTCPQG